MGLNNHGAELVARRLGRVAKGLPPLGINIVKTPDPKILGQAAIDDFRDCLRIMIGPASYITLNVSCPNTSDGNTFEDPVALDSLLKVIIQERNETRRNVPILVKLSPPMFDRMVFDSRVDEIVAVGLAHGIDGFVLCNTSSQHETLKTPPERVDAIGPGGLSGAPLEGRSTRMIRYVHRKCDGAIPIVGVGGISSAEDAFRKILAGASLLQLYTGLVYEGPSLIKRIKVGLAQLLLERGFNNIRDAVGKEDHFSIEEPKQPRQARAMSA
jgi:dihydroorotate dehydrogenase